ncbi:hypothetical protein C8R43DRAFT_1151712 [Mycena crocata]|nr:hypothetical protein C8R43DRAFT_1151712 [Mycena crocata]
MGVAALLTGNGEIIAVHFRAKVAAEIYFLRILATAKLPSASIHSRQLKFDSRSSIYAAFSPESLLNSLQVQIRFKFLIDFDAFKVGRTGLSVSGCISHRELVVKVNLLRRVFDMSLKGFLANPVESNSTPLLAAIHTDSSTTGQGFQISLERRNYAQSASVQFGLKAASGDVVFREPRMPLWFRIQNKPLRYTYLQMYRVRLPAVGISVIGSLRAGAQSRREDEARDVFSHFSTPLIVWLRKSSRPSLPVSCSDFERSGLGLKSTRHGFPLTRVKPAAARLAFRMFRTKGRATSSFEWNRRRGLVRSGSSSGDAKSPVPRARKKPSAST